VQLPAPTRFARYLHTALHRYDRLVLALTDRLPRSEHSRCTFGDGVIHVSRRLSPYSLRVATSHEVIHLARGPVHKDYADIEEILVEQATAEALVPQLRALAAIDHQWTNEEIVGLADAWGVDEALLHSWLDPQTMPIPVIPAQRDTPPGLDLRRASQRRYSGRAS
jgi:hypothetical protein